MKIITIMTLMISLSVMAESKKENKGPNQMTCEKVHGDYTISGRPDIERCENKKEVCFSHANGLSCYLKPKE